MTARPIKIAEAATLLGISPDTVRRRASAAGIEVMQEGSHQSLAGADVARLASAEAADSRLAELGHLTPVSSRNRLRGIVTRVQRDGVMAQVDVQAGPFRLVSLISREAADDLGLEIGSLVAAAVKATNVSIEAIR